VGFPGAILAWGGRVFVSDLGSWPDTGANVMVLDASTLAILDSVTPGGGMAGLSLAGGKIYAGAAVSRKIFRFDPLGLQIEDSVELSATPGDLASDGSSLFVLTPDAVERIPLSTFEPDTVPLISRTAGLYNYALAYDAMSGELYVSTILTGGGSGQISVLDVIGRSVAPPFAAGIFPGAFGFYRPGAR
jgi:DNA-binding beta-propeller fold protein YncE